jgi:hypothetical protein
MISSLIAGTATATMAPAAFGAAEWCEDDPLVVVKTPTGFQLPLHVTNYAEGIENQVYLARVPDNQSVTNPWISWTVVQSKKGGKKPNGTAASAVLWDVTITVTIHTDPGDGLRFRTKTVASSDVNGNGVRYAQTQGISNRQMELRFSMWA